MNKLRGFSLLKTFPKRLSLLLGLLAFLFTTNSISAQIVINEIQPNGFVELKNLGSTTVDVADYWLCDFPQYQSIANSNLDCGAMMMAPGSILTVNNFNTISGADGEMGLYTDSNFGSSNSIIDYVEWGSTGHTRSPVAQAANIWTAGDFVPAFSGSLAYDGGGDSSSDWTAGAPTLCAENVACNAMSPSITTSNPTTICVDGIADPINVTTSGGSGAESAWIITDATGEILALPGGPPFDLDGAGPGVCQIWYLLYDNVTGLETGENISGLDGCFGLSNEITVTRNEPNGGMLTGGPFEFCAGDGIEDNVSGIILDGNSGGNSQWVVTDEQGNILGLPPMPGAVNFDGAGAGTCLIWHLSYEDGLQGLMMGMNTSNLSGCYALSNPVTVVRLTGSDCPSTCDVTGGTLTGGPFEFCVGDGIEDNVSGITLSGNDGPNSQWVVTDEQGNILGLPPMPGVVNFDGAGPGTCLIWHLSYEDGLQGAEMGSNANDLVGCYELSNPVTVVRNQPEGGTLEGGPFEFCVGDGIADNVSGISLSGNSGGNSQWVVTDEQGNILGLPPMPSAVNFDGAGPGICLIWHLSFEDGLEGAEMGMNANDLEGCYDLSNPIRVVRNQPDGGTLEGGRYEFCVNDGVTDNVSGISLTGNTGTNSQWVVTDEQGNILGLPPMPSAVDFEGAGAGVCLIWHLSYEDGLVGAEMGMNANDLVGCYDLSNAITVYRFEDPNCANLCVINGGTLKGGSYEFCVGDGIDDNVSDLILSGNTGTNSQWVVTDDQGNILGLPPSPEAVNFDGAGAGTCLIWHLSYEDGLVGAEMGMNANDLVGCYDLSNPITVIRNQPDGGTLEGGRYEFCVNDGNADNVSGITLTGNTGTNSQWVVTDEQGNILGLPPMPSAVNFEGAGAGVCLIWHLSYEDGLEGAEMGMNANDLVGCYDLSNAITVYRFEDQNCGNLCVINGGSLAGGSFEFCVDDGIADNVSGITLNGNTGTNSQWVVTDDQGNILGLPPTPEAVNFEGVGAGTCLIWHLSYEDGLMGAEMGMNANDLVGCYDLSNPITVYRLTGDDCSNACTAEGGTLEGGPFEFCVGDGIADNVSGITLSGNTGTNSQWVVTDDQGNILGLPPMPSAVNFDGAGPGTCLIWHLSYEDGLEGAEMGMNANDLVGCFDLSNPITVVRNQPDGGILEGGPYEFCVGDGIADNVSGITLSGNSGSNAQWVVTDEQGNILGLPPSPEAVNFDGAGAGTCLIWHLSFEDGLEGAEMGMNANELIGCFDLSNPITVVRNQPDGGVLEGGPFEFCVGDGIEDNVSGITLSGNTGSNSQWVVTDDQGNILGLPPMPSAVNFDGAGPGTCLIWHLSYEDGLEGAEMGMNANDLVGCFDLSNPITVVRNQPDGGTLEGGPFEFCVGDGIEDNVSGITLNGNSGSNSQWVVTDDQGNILGLPPMPSAVNFDGAGAGTCLIWHLSFEDGLEGAEMGMNANDLVGCYDLSNPIMVVRLSGDDCNTTCNAEGGTLEGGPFEFCVGDGIADNVSGITLSGNSGSNSQWVVTDDQGNILGLPPMPSAVNFDGAGPGTCLIWHLSFEDGLEGAEMGMNANDLVGCFDLSNPITVVRNQPDGGTLEGGPFEFCVGDGIEDNVSGITLSGNSGSNSQWVVTDDQGNILGLPPMPSAVNFDGAGAGTCLIWHLSFEDGLEGAEMGMNANDLVGCYDLSNPITVVRLSGDDCNTTCNADGGTLEGGPFEFCVGDGIADNVSGITLSGNSGTNSQWVVTDDQGNILGLPPMPSAVNFDGAGPGTCLIWHLSFEDGLEGAEMGMNANDLEGCFDLSNPITVVRNQPDGGTLTGGPFTFCVGDGIADNVSGIELNGNTGSNSQWVVTDDQGNILGLPPMPSAVNFDGAGAGTCLIWHLSFEDGLEGAEMGMNANDLVGCYDLSNPITVIRNTGNDCNNNGVDVELSITVDDGFYDQYEEVAYTITVSNTGDATATNVDVSAALPSGMVFTSADASQGEYELFFEEWYVGDLAPGQSETLELTLFTLVEEVNITNFVQVIAQDQNDADSTPDNNNGNDPAEDDEAAVTIKPRSEGGSGNGPGSIDLSLSISTGQSTYDQYEEVEYTITLNNDGVDAATNIIVAAGLPNGMVYTSSSTSAGDYNLFFEEWTLDELAAGASATLTLTLFTLVEDVDITNFVEVFSAAETDTDSTPGNGNGTTPQEDDEAAVTLTYLENVSAPLVNDLLNDGTSEEVKMTAMVYPNPAVTTTNLRINQTVASTATINIYDVTGRLAQQQVVELEKGVNNFDFNIADLNAGNYFIRITSNTGQTANHRFVKID